MMNTLTRSGASFALNLSAQLMFRLTRIKPVLVSLRRNRRRRAAAATALFVTTSCVSNNFPPSFRPTAQSG